MMTSGPFLLLLQVLRWTSTLLFAWPQQGTGLGAGGFALGQSSLKLGKRAGSGCLAGPELLELIEDSREGRRKKKEPSPCPSFSG